MNTDDYDALPCRTTDPELWFMDGSNIETRRLRDQAVAMCQECPVREACLRMALGFESGDAQHRHGVYGGTLPEERAQPARRRAVA